SYRWKYSLPSRCTLTSHQEDSALTAETPTPCRPPETLYEPPPNLPPACRVVITTSSADFFFSGCISTGIPRPLSSTVTELSSWIVTTIRLQTPASASSMELSTTS